MIAEFVNREIISTHALLAEGDFLFLPQIRGLEISTHALLAEGDGLGLQQVPHGPISTHALLAEGDRPHAAEPAAGPYFNPRPPCGGRL